ncbi:glycine cleavage system protein GcvH [Diaminobutyricimonas sp. LJ205]|uniref:glycine cleavage system protein GcvH n=1 Tax=Diaminobutyricimonas sp. LJ205 TaxID=2683590 RepID=UPI0012F48829|nr:glycine cleavage system protein GcvH [Diaminobutyricimonas sp. LJ205]
MPDLNALKYTADHEWLEIDGDVVTVGITDYAADQLGDLVFVDLPQVGASVQPGAVVSEVESTKSVGEVSTPIAGEVIERNDAIIENPELVNADAFAGWLFKLRIDPAALDATSLLSRDEYTEQIGQ